MLDPVTLINSSLEAATYIYAVSKTIKENRRECIQFFHHASEVLKLLESRCKGELHPGYIDRLKELRHVIHQLRNTVKAISEQKFLRRVLCHDDVTRRIQKAYNEMSRAIEFFGLGTMIDLHDMQRRNEEAQRHDNSFIDRKCDEILRGNEDILQRLDIQQNEMREALVSIRKRLARTKLPSERKVLQTSMQEIERRSRASLRPSTVPDEFVITSLEVIIDKKTRLGAGGFAEVYRAQWRGQTVAVKVLDKSAGTSQTTFEKEVNIWRTLHHPNILQFYGACSIADPPFIVCALKRNGNAAEYLRRYPKADIVKVLLGAALGLEYLHSRNVVHGDLKGNNILIDELGDACLADFGLSKIKLESTLSIGPRMRYGSVRWMAPEILTRGGSSKEGDIYSFGMTMYELYSGHPPWSGYPDEVIQNKVCQGLRPQKLQREYSGFDSFQAVWYIIELSWHQDRSKRPIIDVVADALHEIAEFKKPKSCQHVAQRAYSTGNLREQTRPPPSRAFHPRHGRERAYGHTHIRLPEKDQAFEIPPIIPMPTLPPKPYRPPTPLSSSSYGPFPYTPPWLPVYTPGMWRDSRSYDSAPPSYHWDPPSPYTPATNYSDDDYPAQYNEPPQQPLRRAPSRSRGVLRKGSEGQVRTAAHMHTPKKGRLYAFLRSWCP